MFSNYISNNNVCSLLVLLSLCWTWITIWASPNQVVISKNQTFTDQSGDMSVIFKPLIISQTLVFVTSAVKCMYSDEAQERRNYSFINMNTLLSAYSVCGSYLISHGGRCWMVAGWRVCVLIANWWGRYLVVALWTGTRLVGALRWGGSIRRILLCVVPVHTNTMHLWAHL